MSYGLPDALHAAIRKWAEDITNIDTHREAEYAGENLAAYLEQAGFLIAPDCPVVRREQRRMSADVRTMQRLRREARQ